MKSLAIAGTALAALAWAGAALALPVRDLYEAEVLVAGENALALQEGAQQGLLEVLVRVSGRQQFDMEGPIELALQDPRAYYYQYSYETRQAPAAPGEQPEEQIWLKLSFEAKALSALLREAELPVWGTNRPAVLLWIASPVLGAAPASALGTEKQLLSAEKEGPLLNAFLYQSKRRGLPFLLPLLDLEDTTQISPDEVWDGILARVEAASRRYSPDAMLIGRVQPKGGGGWWGSWRYELGDGWRRLDNATDTLVELVEAPMNALADSLAARYAIDSTTSAITMKVDGIDGAAAYAEASRYLESLTPVVSTWLRAMQGDQAEFDMQIEGQQEQLAEIIGLDARMRFLAREGPTALRYLWIR